VKLGLCGIPFLGIFVSNFRYWFFSGWERYSIYYLHIEGMCTAGLHFQTFAVLGSIEARIYLPAHVWRAIGTGVRYSLMTPYPVCSRLIQDGGFAWLTCLTIAAPKMSSFP
jgi:hypothetical protein